MKVCILMGSPRKRDSYRFCKLIEKQMPKQTDIEFEYLFLNDFHIEDCKGCDQCFQKGEQFCPCKDDLHIVKEKLLQADGIIFASPVYTCHVTGSLKRVIDRLAYLFHRQEFIGKPALIVVTTGGGGQKPTEKYLKMTACGWGCNLIGKNSIISSMFFESDQKQSALGYSEKYYMSKMKKLQKIVYQFEKAMAGKELPVPTFYDIYMFQCLRSKTYTSIADYNFWKEKGWMDSKYFYPVTLNPLKLLFGICMKCLVDTLAKRVLASGS